MIMKKRQQFYLILYDNLLSAGQKKKEEAIKLKFHELCAQ